MILTTDLKGDEAIRERNKLIYGSALRIWGGDGDGDADPPGEGADEGEDGDEDDDEGDEGPEDSDKSAKKKPARKPAKSSSADDEDDEDDEDDKDAELDRIKRENIRLKKQIQSKDDKDKDEKDKDKRLSKAEAKNARYEKLMRTSYIENAINKVSAVKNKDGNPIYEWHDIEDVRSAIDMDSISINMDTGEVEGLDVELKRIAKKKPHYLRQADDGGDQGKGRGNQGGGRRPPPPGASGAHPFGGAARARVTDDQKLMEKYKIGSPLRSVSG